MQLARIIGTLVATRKYQGLEGVKFLIVQPLDRQRRPKGEPVIAADATAQAGRGELVFIIGIREAALALPTTFVPVDHAVVGIVDLVDTAEEQTPSKKQAAGDPAPRQAVPGCINPQCRDYGKPDAVIRHGRTRHAVQRYLCKTCGNTFIAP
jgi:ethanolamine utilization protein EutN